MNQSVHKEYMPKADTITALKDGGYGRKQIWNLILLFRKNFDGKPFEDIDRKFRDVVRKEPAHNLAIPATPKSEVAHDKKRALDLSNKPEDAHEKAVAAKKVDSDKMSQADALAFYNRGRNPANN